MSIFQDKKNNFTKILLATEKKFGHGKSSDWKNKDFENLSFEINRETKILISPATLKRLFGKVKTSENYTPQEITIQALKDYSGFVESVTKKPTGAKRRLYLSLSAILLFLIAFGIVFLTKNKDTTRFTEDCILELVKVEGQGPATAFFKYSVPENNDSIFLDYGDATQWTHIEGKDRTRTHFYGIPGLLEAGIRTRTTRLSHPVNVFIPTTGLKALAYYLEEKEVNRYYPVPLEGNINNGIFHASRKSLAGIGLDSTKIVVVQLDNYSETNKNGDSFVLKSNFKNNSFWPGIRCYSVYYTVQGTFGQIMFKFVGKGCSGYGEYVLSEKSASGAGADLSGFAVNLNNWSEIEIRNENKNVSVLIAGSEIFNDYYEQSIGEILGTTIMFHGSGALDYFYLNDVNGDVIFEEGF